jgi:intracellular sulfur oxidation DsrE/DsrF family protein
MMADMTSSRRGVLGAGALLAGAGAVGSAAHARPAGAGAWSPAFDPVDDWMDEGGKLHRALFDTTTAGAATGAVRFVNNLYVANKQGYGIEPGDLGMILVLRAGSTPFGYNDSIWQKYGATLTGFLKLEGKQAEVAKTANPLLGEDGEGSLAGLAAKGTRFAICGMATHGISGVLAKAAGKDAGEVEADIKANLIPGGVIVPAGIAAVNRAQERGYTFTYVSE